MSHTHTHKHKQTRAHSSIATETETGALNLCAPGPDECVINGHQYQRRPPASRARLMFGSHADEPPAT